MLRFFATRLGWLLVTVLVVTFLVFCVNEFSPGQVARKIVLQDRDGIILKRMKSVTAPTAPKLVAVH